MYVIVFLISAGALVLFGLQGAGDALVPEWLAIMVPTTLLAILFRHRLSEEHRT